MRAQGRAFAVALDAVLICGLALGSAGCGQRSDGAQRSEAADDPWSETLRKQAENSDNEYVRKSLSDGKLSSREINDAVERMTSCAAKLGLQAKLNPDGSGSYAGDMSSSETKEELQRCGKTTGYDELSSLYSSMRINPDNTGSSQELILDCWKRNGLVPKAMSWDEYVGYLEDGGQESKTSTWHKMFGAYADPDDPSYDSEKGAIWQACSTDPTHH